MLDDETTPVEETPTETPEVAPEIAPEAEPETVINPE